MAKSRKQKVTLSIDSAIYNKFKAFCEQNAIMLSKKIEIWMRQEPQQPQILKIKSKSKSMNKKITLSINVKVYQQFQEYCEDNAIMLSKKVELWMRNAIEK